MRKFELLARGPGYAVAPLTFPRRPRPLGITDEACTSVPADWAREAAATRVALVGGVLLSSFALALGLSVLALPFVLPAMVAKASAVRAFLAGRAEAARDRLALALVLDVSALLAWGPGMLAPAPRMVIALGGIGIAGTLLAWLELSRRATIDRRRRAITQMVADGTYRGVRGR